ncbi:MAG: leucine-rich repeat domain-containing protein, partial [Clostridia bacterium]|nr:leucine-rich repeat domain-containing protein [Clostridia bacterium]
MINVKDFKIENGVLYTYRGSSEAVVIPNYVTSVAKSAFAENKKLKSVTVPRSVREIGEAAFRNCCNLKSVKISASAAIADMAFKGCEGLCDENGFVTVNGIVFDYYGEERSPVIPDGVRVIGMEAFFDKSCLRHITLPDSVTEIGRSAFTGCKNLTRVFVSDNVTD